MACGWDLSWAVGGQDGEGGQCINGYGGVGRIVWPSGLHVRRRKLGSTESPGKYVYTPLESTARLQRSEPHGVARLIRLSVGLSGIEHGRYDLRAFVDPITGRQETIRPAGKKPPREEGEVPLEVKAALDELRPYLPPTLNRLSDHKWWCLVHWSIRVANQHRIAERTAESAALGPRRLGSGNGGSGDEIMF